MTDVGLLALALTVEQSLQVTRGPDLIVAVERSVRAVDKCTDPRFALDKARKPVSEFGGEERVCEHKLSSRLATRPLDLKCASVST